MKVFVILPSYLHEYPNCASNREYKFVRSVNSFLSQTYSNKELIIVSDGCEITNNLYDIHFSKYSNIKLIKLPKQPLFSGKVRSEGLNSITNEKGIVCYLDSDDTIQPFHLFNIVESFINNSKLEWIYFDDILNVNNGIRRDVILQGGRIGTSNLAHINNYDKFNWLNCNGYGHDWTFITTKLMSSKEFMKINNTGYIVHHIPNGFDN